MTIATAHLRVARPTNNIAALLLFYRDGLGFEVLGRFADHQGFDGVMLGHKNAPYHLEFTHKRGHDAGRAPSQGNLLVWYLPQADDYNSALTRMKQAGFASVTSFNPYWDACDTTFEDPDGYRVVLASRESPV